MGNIGWIDFSDSDRKLVMDVLKQLGSGNMTDPFGIKPISLAFSNKFFPGTSTNQTRAKYLLLIPYLCMELRKLKEDDDESARKKRGDKSSPKDFIVQLEALEDEIVKKLKAAGATDGLIGQRRGEDLMSKPSSRYWNALRTYEILTSPLKRTEFARAVDHIQREEKLRKTSGKQRTSKEQDENDFDDPNAGLSRTSFWSVPNPPSEWQKTLSSLIEKKEAAPLYLTKDSLDLTYEEAKYLLEQITNAPKTRDSLLALILKEKRVDFVDFKDFKDIGFLESIMPPPMKEDYRLGKEFFDFMKGPYIRYQILHSEGKDEGANKQWERYVEERPPLDIGKIEKFAHDTPARKKTIQFLKAFQELVGQPSQLDELDKLIIARERSLKGKERAKLSNKEKYPWDKKQTTEQGGVESDSWSNRTYRFSQAKRLVKDIFDGLSKKEGDHV